MATASHVLALLAVLGCGPAPGYSAPPSSSPSPSPASSPASSPAPAPAPSPQPASDPAPTPAPASTELADAINRYRHERGLAPIPISPSLMAVAAAHARDLVENEPVTDRCNFHSWSSRGEWSSCCYTANHAEARCMWNKPRELTRYPGNGYEIAAGGSSAMTVEQAIALWDDSPLHRDVVVNGGRTWREPWQALGAAMHGEYAVAWFGNEPEP